MNKELEAIGSKVKRQRQFLNYSREKLAELADVSSKTIANIEDGKQEMGVTTIIKICNSLNLSPNYLIFDKEAWSNQELVKLLENCPPSVADNVKLIVLASLDMYNGYKK